MSKPKTIESPPLLDEEIRDVKKALKSKGKIYSNLDDLLKDLHKAVGMKD